MFFRLLKSTRSLKELNLTEIFLQFSLKISLTFAEKPAERFQPFDLGIPADVKETLNFFNALYLDGLSLSLTAELARPCLKRDPVPYSPL